MTRTDPTFGIGPAPIDETRMKVVDQVPLVDSVSVLNGYMMRSLFKFLGSATDETPCAGPKEIDHLSQLAPDLTVSSSSLSSWSTSSASSSPSVDNTVLPDSTPPTSSAFVQNCSLSASATNTLQRDSTKKLPVIFQGGQTELWELRYKELAKFREKHGHSLVPLNNESAASIQLGNWVKRNRSEYKKMLLGKHSTMTKERIEKLERLDFVWDSQAAKWEERWNQLAKFQRRHGHCIVSRTSRCEKERQLAIWIKSQRRQFTLYCEQKRSNMTPKRIEKLKRLGFNFGGSHSSALQT